jgi:hypothetical protein
MYATNFPVLTRVAHADLHDSLPLVTDAKLDFEPLRSALFPGVSSSVQTHNGFGDAHAAYV